jgi:cytochrome c
MLSRRNNAPLVVGGVAGAVLLLCLGFWMESNYEGQELARKAEAMTLGNVRNGRQAFGKYGCGGCHTMLGVSGAGGTVGPPLDGIAARGIIGGRLANNPDNMRAWIQRPQSISPGTAMPDLGVTDRDSRDIAAFLYTRT